MSAAYDGHRAKITVEHALSCKMDGLVKIRHDDVADERRRRRIGIFRTAWKCGRTLHLWFTLWMALRVARLGMRRRGWPPTCPASGTVNILRVYYVRVRMAITVFHVNSLLIHGSRD